MLDLIMLGTGGGMPMPKRHLSSMLITYNGRKILIDCGEGTQVAMRKFRSGYKALDIICLTHFHGDHIFGLPGLLATLGNSDRLEPVTIVGPKGLRQVMDSIVKLIGYLPFDLKLIEDPKSKLDFRITNEILELVDKDTYDISISTMDLKHSSPCLGYKLYVPRDPKFYPEKAKDNMIPLKFWSKLQAGEEVHDEGKTYKPSMVLGEKRRGIMLTYITDTRPIEEIVDFSKNSDFFVCEGTYGDSLDREKAIKNTHMTFEEAARLAKKANVGKLLLTHFSPSMDQAYEYEKEASHIFENTIIGYDGYSDTLIYK